MKTVDTKTAGVKKKSVFAAAGISVIVHVVLFIFVGGWVVAEYVVKRHPMTGEMIPTMEDTSLPPDESSESPDQPENSTPTELPSEAPSASPDPDVTPIDVLSVSSSLGTFQMPAPTSNPGAFKESPGAEPKSGSSKIGNPFGGLTRSDEGSLEGVLYDLKQTPGRKSNGMNGVKYVEVLTEFLKKNWDRKVLNEYYKVRTPLYTSQIYIPNMDAAEAPKAFQVEKDVQPAQWIVLYQGSFQVPKSGSYRFAGYADDALVVRVNDVTVLDASRISMGFDTDIPKTPMLQIPGEEMVTAHRLGSGYTAYSDWIPLNENQANKIEILLGERPGGFFCAYLFIENKGKKYKMEPGGRPILPLFRTANTDTVPAATGEAVFEKDGPVFKMK